MSEDIVTRLRRTWREESLTNQAATEILRLREREAAALAKLEIERATAASLGRSYDAASAEAAGLRSERDAALAQLAGMVDPDTVDAMYGARWTTTYNGPLIKVEVAARVADVRTAAAVAPYLAVLREIDAYAHNLPPVIRELVTDSLEGKAP